MPQPRGLRAPKAIAPIAVQLMRMDRGLKVPETAPETVRDMLDATVDVTMRATRVRAGITLRMTAAHHGTRVATPVTTIAAANGPHRVALARIQRPSHNRITPAASRSAMDIAATRHGQTKSVPVTPTGTASSRQNF